ncbi:MAG TPA: hypothetical protein VMU21_12285 [Thermodesulfovibrionales bacterium]|nr:hypothetical protein [Thermodesulfovibrionales bacterium]
MAEHKGKNGVVLFLGIRTGRALSLSASFILCAVLSLLFTSCATKKLEIPTYEGVDPKVILEEREHIKMLESTFSIEFEKEGSVVKGEGALRLTPDSLDLQVYSFGFLVAEVSSNSTATSSNPPIDRNKLSLLVEGLRNSFFWWSVKNPDIRDDHGTYRVSNSWKKVFIDKKTMMPLRQTIELDEGRQLDVKYEGPAFLDGVWFPSKMRIALSHQSVNLTIETLSLKE